MSAAGGEARAANPTASRGEPTGLKRRPRVVCNCRWATTPNLRTRMDGPGEGAPRSVLGAHTRSGRGDRVRAGHSQPIGAWMPWESLRRRRRRRRDICDSHFKRAWDETDRTGTRPHLGARIRQTPASLGTPPPVAGLVRANAARESPRQCSRHRGSYRFDSKLEARRFQELQLMEVAGRITRLRFHSHWDLHVGATKAGLL